MKNFPAQTISEQKIVQEEGWSAGDLGPRRSLIFENVEEIFALWDIDDHDEATAQQGLKINLKSRGRLHESKLTLSEKEESIQIQ